MTTPRSTCRRVWYARLTRDRGNCAGDGIPFRPLSRTPRPRQRRGAAAPPTPGPSCPSIPTDTSSLSRPAVPVRTITAGFGAGAGEWADAVVALHAATGELAWGFQLVHHDLWDYDSAAPPLLTTLPRDGQSVPV